MSLWHPDTYRLGVTLLASIIQGQAWSVQQELACVKMTESQSLLGRLLLCEFSCKEAQYSFGFD